MKDEIENNINKGLRSDNTSGVTGVSYRPKDKKWESYITYNKKLYKLGLFTNLEDAIKARKKAEKELFKEWSYDESIKKAEVNNK